MHKKIAFHLLFAVGYVLIIGTQYLYEQSLFDFSTFTLIPSLQNKIQPLTAGWNFWNFFTSFIAGGILQIAFIVANVILLNSNAETQFLVIGIVVELFFMGALKNFHHSPRPFWVNYYQGTPGEGVFVKQCTSQFGNPSGHSLFASYFSMYIFFAYLHGVSGPSFKRENKILPNSKKISLNLTDIERTSDQELGMVSADVSDN